MSAAPAWRGSLLRCPPPWAIWGLNCGAQLARMSDPDWPTIVLSPVGGEASPHLQASSQLHSVAVSLRGADFSFSFKPPPPPGACLTPFLLWIGLVSSALSPGLSRSPGSAHSQLAGLAWEPRRGGAGVGRIVSFSLWALQVRHEYLTDREMEETSTGCLALCAPWQERGGQGVPSARTELHPHPRGS